MSVEVGSIVCVHNNARARDTWIGIVIDVATNTTLIARRLTRTYRVKQLGRRQITSFTFQERELRETVVTFEGPMCVECGRPR